MYGVRYAVRYLSRYRWVPPNLNTLLSSEGMINFKVPCTHLLSRQSYSAHLIQNSPYSNDFCSVLFVRIKRWKTRLDTQFIWTRDVRPGMHQILIPERKPDLAASFGRNCRSLWSDIYIPAFCARLKLTVCLFASELQGKITLNCKFGRFGKKCRFFLILRAHACGCTVSLMSTYAAYLTPNTWISTQRPRYQVYPR